ncbi:MAG: hypothetical protein IPG04_36300 [Polyangiaceae bacterium]|nr:hypothetical protein [Polyangiaceae bacterium]
MSRATWLTLALTLAACEPAPPNPGEAPASSQAPGPSGEVTASASSPAASNAVASSELPVAPTPPDWALPPYEGPPLARIYPGGSCVRLVSGDIRCRRGVMTDAMTGADLRDATQIWGFMHGGCASFADGSLRCWGDNGSFVFGEMRACPEKWVLTPHEDYAYRRSAPCPKPTVVEGVRDVASLRAFDSADDSEHTTGITLSILSDSGRHFVLGFDERYYSSVDTEFCHWAPLTRPTERPRPYRRCLHPPPHTGTGERYRKIVMRRDELPRLCGIQLDGTLTCWGGAPEAIIGREVSDLTEDTVFFRSQDGWMRRLDWSDNLHGEGVAEPPFPFPPTEELISGQGLEGDRYDKSTWLCGRLTSGRIVCALEDRRPTLLPMLEDIVDLEGNCALRKDGAAYCFAPGVDGWRITPFELEPPWAR